MGQARSRKRAHHDLLKTQPRCIYCGGKTPAVTIDHIPPVAMFSLKQRPKGLEMSACDGCNRGSRLADLLVSLISRVYPDTRTIAELEELEGLLSSVRNNFPGVLEQMQATPEMQQKLRQKIAGSGIEGHALNFDVPAINDAVRIFGAKLGMALHCEMASEIVPVNGGVAVRWYSNVNAIAGEIPPIIFEMFDQPRTLRQGWKVVAEQFEYDSRVTPDKSFGLHWATVRRSFAVLALSFMDESRLSEFEDISAHMKVVRPGDFRKV